MRFRVPYRGRTRSAKCFVDIRLVLLLIGLLLVMIEVAEAAGRKNHPQPNRRGRVKKHRRGVGKDFSEFLWVFGTIMSCVIGPVFFLFLRSLYKDPAVPQLAKAAWEVIKSRLLSYLGRPSSLIQDGSNPSSGMHFSVSQADHSWPHKMPSTHRSKSAASNKRTGRTGRTTLTSTRPRDTYHPSGRSSWQHSSKLLPTPPPVPTVDWENEDQGKQNIALELAPVSGWGSSSSLQHGDHHWSGTRGAKGNVSPLRIMPHRETMRTGNSSGMKEGRLSVGRMVDRQEDSWPTGFDWGAEKIQGWSSGEDEDRTWERGDKGAYRTSTVSRRGYRRGRRGRRATPG